MLAPKLIYIIIIIWLLIRGFNVSKENKMNMFYTSTKALAPMCFCQARRVKKNINSLSVCRFKNGMKFLKVGLATFVNPIGK